jgi:predicted CoA-binding protein
MAKNKITDLNDHLFVALERLNDDDLAGDKLREEIERSKAIALVGGKVIDGMKAQTEMFTTLLENGYRPVVPEQFKMLSEGNNG